MYYSAVSSFASSAGASSEEFPLQWCFFGCFCFWFFSFCRSFFCRSFFFIGASSVASAFRPFFSAGASSAATASSVVASTGASSDASASTVSSVASSVATSSANSELAAAILELSFRLLLFQPLIEQQPCLVQL